MEKEIIIDNQLDEVARIALFIEELGMSLQLPAGITMSLNLAIEEAVTNIIRYGYPPIKKVKSSFEHLLLPECWLHKLLDDGISFDPTAKETSDNVQSLDQQLTQGLGLFLIRQYNGQSRISFHR